MAADNLSKAAGPSPGPSLGPSPGPSPGPSLLRVLTANQEPPKNRRGRRRGGEMRTAGNGGGERGGGGVGTRGALITLIKEKNEIRPATPSSSSAESRLSEPRGRPAAVWSSDAPDSLSLPDAQ